jgi:hypothetical protein
MLKLSTNSSFEIESDGVKRPVAEITGWGICMIVITALKNG